jgi:hypothetical protein
MTCRSGCSTPGLHESWGACARAAEIQIDRHGLKGFRSLERDKDNRLDAYASARKAGLQPQNTSWAKVRQSFEDGGVPPTPVMQEA